ncbi:MAG: T9SS type A sorting domain-containing protein [Chitinophagales bacterium]
MKNRFLPLLIAVFTFTAGSLFGQYCGNSASGICTPGGPYSQLGFYPSYDQFPCATIASAFSQKVDMQIPATTVYNGLTVPLNSIKIDSIENLPCGLCWSTNSSTNTFTGGSTGCIVISGTTYDAVGQYKLRIRVTVNSIVTLTNQDASQFGIKYFVRVQAPGGTCAAVDTNAAGLQTTASGSITTPTINGVSTICGGGSSALSVGGTYQTYVWSTGALTSSINVSNAGTYTVTVYDHCSSATASKTVATGSADATITPSGPLTFCTGSSVTLSAPAGQGSYSWSNASSAQSITVNTSGTYSVTTTNNGCSATSSATVTVTGSSLSPVITPASINICPGGDATLDVGAGYTTYAWSNAGNTQSITVNSGGTYTVTVTQGGCNGTASATVNVGNFPVAVNISPAGPVTACDGDQVTLDAGNGYDGYNWSGGGVNQTVNVTTSGSYVVTVQDNGCVGKDTVVVTFNPIPSATISPVSPVSLCSGQTVTLDAGAGFASYSWTNGSTTQAITVSNAGTYDVTVTQNGCTGGSSGAITVNVTATPNANITVGSGNVLTVAGGASSYQWYHNQTLINTATDSSYTVPSGQSGLYSVIASNGACADTGTVTISGIENLFDVSNFSLLPNPANDNVSVNYTIVSATKLQVVLLDLTGKIVSELVNDNQAAGKHSFNFNVAALPAGVYLVNFRTEAGSFNTKFIKQ